MMTNNIVIGLGFGDEGKGRVVDYLCSLDPRSIVVRFNGGQQAGHTVVKDGKKHTFSSFGSGTFQGAPTYWSSYCTFCPTFFMTELRALTALGCSPEFSMSEECPLTTPYDIIYNRALERVRGIDAHGSCGVGFGATIERHYHSPYKLFARDLVDMELLTRKLLGIESYYYHKAKENEGLAGTYFHMISKTSIEPYLKECEECKEHLSLENEAMYLTQYAEEHNFIFEGAQGIMLDQDYGIFPHVTRSHTTSRNAVELLQKHKLGSADMNYVTRAYQTRHGNGPMMGDTSITVTNPNEANVTNKYQGEFRKAALSRDTLSYALLSDLYHSHMFKRRSLFITCMDQISGTHLKIIHDAAGDKGLQWCSPKNLGDYLGIENVFVSHSDKSEDKFTYISVIDNK